MGFFSLSNAIRLMLVVGVVAFLAVNVKSCQKPSVGFDAYARGSLSRLSTIDAPPPQPALVFTNPDGDTMTLADLRGRKVLLNVWASWCAPCVAELPMLEQVAQEREGVEVVTISLDRRMEDMETFLEREGLDLPPWWDNSFSLPGKLAAPGLPLTVLYNETGAEVARLAGEADWTSPEADALLDAFEAM